MFDAVKRMLTAEGPAVVNRPDAQRQRLRVATCVLLLEAAQADDALVEAEIAAVNDLVRKRFDLAADEVAELLDAANAQRRGASDLYGFTRLINEHFTRPQKLAIVELLWRIVYSDGRLEEREDAMLHRVANLLQVRQEELIALKLKVKQDPDGPLA